MPCLGGILFFLSALLPYSSIRKKTLQVIFLDNPVMSNNGPECFLMRDDVFVYLFVSCPPGVGSLSPGSLEAFQGLPKSRWSVSPPRSCQSRPPPRVQCGCRIPPSVCPWQAAKNRGKGCLIVTQSSLWGHGPNPVGRDRVNKGRREQVNNNRTTC